MSLHHRLLMLGLNVLKKEIWNLLVLRLLQIILILLKCRYIWLVKHVFARGLR